MLLALMLFAGIFVGCSSEKKPPEKTEASDTGTSEPTTEEYVLPTKDFENTTMTVLVPGGKIWQFDSTWGTNTDVLNLGLYRRDQAVAKALNLDLEMIYQENVSGEWMSQTFDRLISADMMAQDGKYDIVYAEAGYGLDVKGYFYDLLSEELNPILDLEQPFYFQDWNEVAEINGRLVSCVSYASVEMMSSATVTIFNPEWWNTLFEGNIYDYVRDGSWTVDTMKTMVKEANSDLDGGGLDVEQGDKFGLAYMNAAKGLFYSMGGRFVMRDSDGTLTPDFVSDTNISVFEKFYSLIDDTDALLTPWSTPTANFRGVARPGAAKTYLDGQALFVLGYFDTASVIKRSGDLEFGFLPYPKMSKSQETYISTLCGGSAFSIPKSAVSKTDSAIVLNALSYYSYQEVRPAYFNSVLKTKLSENADASYVVDLVMGSLMIDFSYIYDQQLGYVSSKYFDAIMDGKKEYVSTYLELTEKFDGAMEKLLENLMSDAS